MADEDWDDGSAQVDNNIGTNFGMGRGFKPAAQESNDYSQNSSGFGTLNESNERRPGGYKEGGRGGRGGGRGGFNRSNDNQFGGSSNNEDDPFGSDNKYNDNRQGGFESRGGRGGRGRGGRGGGGGNRDFNNDFNNDKGNDDNGDNPFGGSGGGGGGGGGSRRFGNDDNGDREDRFGGRGRGGRGRGRGGGGGNRDFNNDDGGDADNGDNNPFGGGGGGGGGGGFRKFGNDDDNGEREDRFSGRGRGGRGRGRGGGGGNRDFNNENGGGDNDDNSFGFGGGSRKFGNDDNGDREERFSGRGRGRGRGGGRDGDRRDFNNDNNRGGGDGGDGDGDKPEKPREIYIPPEPSNDDEVLFGSGVQAGINFSKYDHIEVKTSGENVPNHVSRFDEINLRSLLNENIKKSGYTVPTPIQKYAIPIILAGRDLMACAQTGSGKTAAFMIPIIHKLLEKPREIADMAAANCVEPRALIMTPTRELAIQIEQETRKFAKSSILKSHVVYGGTSTGHQTRQIFSGCDILVATPGRLLDMVGRGKIVFNSIEFLVIDEVDRMLDPGFINDMIKVLTHDTMPAVGERQTLMFTATFPDDVQEMARKHLRDYIFVTVGVQGAACKDIEQKFIEVKKSEKRAKLIELLEAERANGTIKGTIVFVELKRSADFIAALIAENGFSATSTHGDRLQREREEALNDFKSGRMDILVSTAVGARGWDIGSVCHVINFDLPKEIDEYVHKIGRTGRVGNKGKATSFYDGQIDSRLQGDLVRILTQAGQEIPDWLLSGVGGRDYEPASNFGGEDIRSFSNAVSSSGGAAQSVENDEEW